MSPMKRRRLQTALAMSAIWLLAYVVSKAIDPAGGQTVWLAGSLGTACVAAADYALHEQVVRCETNLYVAGLLIGLVAFGGWVLPYAVSARGVILLGAGFGILCAVISAIVLGVERRRWASGETSPP